MSLRRWLDEKWVRTDTGEPCGSGESVEKSEKYCRPSRRVNSKTPKTVGELKRSKKLKKKQREKKKLSNSGKEPSRVSKAQEGSKVSINESEKVSNKPKGLDGMIDRMIKEIPAYQDLSKEDFYNMLEKVRFVETRDKNIDQKGGLTDAQGYYQIKSTTLPTAKNRLRNLSKEIGFDIEGFDMSKNDSKEYELDEQSMLALANMHKSARKVNQYLPVKDVKKAWTRFHWLGDPDKYSKMEEYYDKTVQEMSTKKSSKIDLVKKAKRFSDRSFYNIPSDLTNVASSTTSVAQETPMFMQTFKRGGKIKSVKDMKCGKVGSSWRKNKKKYKVVCAEGKKKAVHFGQKGYSDFTKHKNKKRRDSFRARHKCNERKNPFSPQKLACKYLW